MTARKDPATVFRFQVEIDGLLVAGFSEISGLEVETEVEVYREGGVNEYEHHLVKIRKYPSLVLKHGFTHSDELWNWFEGVTEGRIERKNGSVIMLDSSGNESYRWNFFSSYPIKWIGPELKANHSEVAIESLEIVHTGLKVMARS